jgi:hypothetical protein
MSIVMNNDQSKNLSMMRFLCAFCFVLDFLVCYNMICRMVLIYYKLKWHGNDLVSQAGRLRFTAQGIPSSFSVSSKTIVIHADSTRYPLSKPRKGNLAPRLSI